MNVSVTVETMSHRPGFVAVGTGGYYSAQFEFLTLGAHAQRGLQ